MSIEKEQAKLIRQMDRTAAANSKRLIKATLFHTALFDHLKEHGSISLEDARRLSQRVQSGRYTSKVFVRRSARPKEKKED